MAHRPIDYSKWDNINTDSGSDSEGQPPSPPPLSRLPPRGVPLAVTSRESPPAGKPFNAPKPGIYLPDGLEPLPQPLPRPPPEPRPGEVLCTFGPCYGDTSERSFRATSLPTDHPAFTRGAPSPVAARVGFPLVVHRLDPRPSLFIPRSELYDNQRVTYMMISPNSGFAGPEWQQGVGPVILARSDKKPLPPQHVEAFWMFCESLLAIFSDGEDPDPAVEMIPAKWQDFFRKYKKSCAARSTRSAEWRDLWLPWETP